VSQCSVCAQGVAIDDSMSNVAWGRKLGLGESSIRRHLKHAPLVHLEPTVEPIAGKADVGPDGGEFTNIQTDAPLGNDWSAIFARFNLDPELFTIVDDTVRMSMWQQSKRLESGERDTINLYSYSARFTRKVNNSANLDDLYAAIDNWTPEVKRVRPFALETLVVCAADLQTGKTDFGLKSTDLTNRVLASFAAAAEIARTTHFAEIVLADLGDIVENINSTSSQRATNDLAITEQVRLARRLMLEGIKLLAPLTDSLIYAAVPSNHGSVRIGPKSPENHVLDDYGIEIAEQLRDICENSDKLANVSFVIPEQSLESLAFTTSGTTLGMAHGHQAQGADGLGKWWAGQSHGRMPLATADLALFGHFHSLRVQQSGDSRWLMVSPSSDSGSSWFTNKTGESSAKGMLSFVTANGQWSELRIL